MKIEQVNKTFIPVTLKITLQSEQDIIILAQALVEFRNNLHSEFDFIELQKRYVNHFKISNKDEALNLIDSFNKELNIHLSKKDI